MQPLPRGPAVPTRLTPAALNERTRLAREDDEATFEPLRHVRHDNKHAARKKRRITERVQQENANARRTA